MNRVPVWTALGGGAMILVLWAVCPRMKIGEASRSPKTPKSAPEVRAPAEPAPTPAVASAPSRVQPQEKLLERSSPLSPVARPRRILPTAPMDSLGYLRGIPSGMGDMGRDAAIHKTADHLSIEVGSRTAFQAAARQSVLDMEQARVLRCREVSALGMVSPSVGDEFRRSIERYAAAREGALGRIEPYLGQTPACQEFRQDFDSWAGLVAVKAEVRNR